MVTDALDCAIYNKFRWVGSVDLRDAAVKNELSDNALCDFRSRSEGVAAAELDQGPRMHFQCRVGRCPLFGLFRILQISLSKFLLALSKSSLVLLSSVSTTSFSLLRQLIFLSNLSMLSSDFFFESIEILSELMYSYARRQV